MFENTAYFTRVFATLTFQLLQLNFLRILPVAVPYFISVNFPFDIFIYMVSVCVATLMLADFLNISSYITSIRLSLSNLSPLDTYLKSNQLSYSRKDCLPFGFAYTRHRILYQTNPPPNKKKPSSNKSVDNGVVPYHPTNSPLFQPPHHYESKQQTGNS